ncbi:glycosylated lysosomal membrane protein B [Bombyx mori]|uniref:Lysosomal protein NCU-G1 n=1 Tax=Bombyx mori TaxID=7091 RepID=A0A8R2M4Y8_BOMMO|nr:glycosylated lysosomal membrane protein B [Bombyx mori]XP_037874393.1 glycosylated lysosomal membrane protein B [Bombyx mori]
MNFLILLLSSAISIVCGQDRVITAKLNPGCAECTSANTLVYIKADSSKDSIHQLWDFTGGIPTVVFALTELNSTMQVKWDRQVPVKFLLSETPKYCFAIAIDKLYEYNDVEDKGHISPQCEQRPMSLKYMSWTLVDSVLSDKEVMVRVHGQYKHSWRAGVVDVKLDLIPFYDYAAELPRLIHTANSTLVDVGLVNITTSKDYNSSRFALHMLLVSTDGWGETMHYTMRKSLDDEHTPGVFEIIEIKTPESYVKDDGGYIQFRPVGYTEPKREVSSSTSVRVSPLKKSAVPERSTLERFFRDFETESLLVQDVFVSIGLTGDQFYRQHNFTSWSFTMGYGSPPLETFSLFVIMIISIGLGVPLLLALSGVVYVVISRIRQRNSNQPTRFTDEE